MAGWRKRGARGGRGFTLLELTVALAIVSAVAAAALRLQHQGFRTYERAGRLTEAVLLAQSKLAEMQVKTPRAGRGKIRTSAGEDLFWEVAVTKARHEGVRAVRVRIRSGAEDPPIVEALTYVAAP